LRVLALFDQALNFRQIVGKGRGCEADSQANSESAQGLHLRKTGLEQGFRSHRYVIIFKVIQSLDSTKNAGNSIGLSASAAPL
jgi:hypothetical protein